MRIAPAKSGDIPALHQLIESAYRGDTARKGWTSEADLLGGQRTDIAALEEIFSDEMQVMLAARDAVHITGCVLLSDKGNSLAYLGMLTVDPELQAAGLGKKLMAAGEEYVANEWNAKAIEMTVITQRIELISWYERRGYTLTGERRPFPHDDPRFGLPKEPLEFVVLEKRL